MAILNYTTSISAEKTALEIQQKLARARAQAVLTEFDEDGIMKAISFRILTSSGMIFFRLPANIDGVFNSLKASNKIGKKFKTKEQATKVAWRILKDWIEAQLALVEIEMADILEVFLPYAQDKEGKTIFEKLKQNNFKQLTHEEI